MSDFPEKCGARHPKYKNVGPCEIYVDEHGHWPTLIPHRGIADGVVEVGFDTKLQRPIFAHRRWWREWYDEPRADWTETRL
jgi:hypothetical protein